MKTSTCSRCLPEGSLERIAAVSIGSSNREGIKITFEDDITRRMIGHMRATVVRVLAVIRGTWATVYVHRSLAPAPTLVSSPVVFRHGDSGSCSGRRLLAVRLQRRAFSSGERQR